MVVVGPARVIDGSCLAIVSTVTTVRSAAAAISSATRALISGGVADRRGVAVVALEAGQFVGVSTSLSRAKRSHRKLGRSRV